MLALPALKPLENDATALADKYDLTSFVNHMLFKEMWGGSNKLMTLPLYCVDRQPIIADQKITGYEWVILKEVMTVSDRFLKCVDEVICNIGDHRQRTKNKPIPHKMTLMNIKFDKQTGRITAINNGDGFDVAIHPNDPAGRYIPEIVSTEALRGSNYKKAEGDVLAGTNGVGLTLVLGHALEVILDTYDINRNVLYYQKYENHLDLINKPVVTQNPADKRPHTKLEFQLDYAAVGWGFLDQKDPNDKVVKPDSQKRRCDITQNILSQLEKIVRYRVCQMGVFLGPECTVYFNDELSPFNTLEKLTRAMYPGKNIYTGTTIYNIHTWDVVIITGLTEYEQTSFINGVECKSGQHLNKIRDIIHDAAKERVKDLFPDMTKYHGQMLSMIGIIVSGNIPNAQWGGGQLKSSIQMDSKLFKDIKLEKKLLNPVCEYLYDRMLLTTKNSKKSNVKPRCDKYTQAGRLGNGSTLILAEGDSAGTMVEKGIRNPKCYMPQTLFGIYTIGGVPMNARKQVEIRHPEGHEEIILQSKSLMNNLSIQEFVAIMNLDYSKSYKTEKELSTLNYGTIMFLFDEDLDGNGCITGLYLNLIHLFWPELIRIGVVKRLRTPLVRVKYKGKIHNFFDENEGKKFMDNIKTEKFEVNYYKGLAAHEDFEIMDIFSNYKQNLITYVLDDKANSIFEMYYLKETDLRKIEFKTPTRPLTDYEKNLLNINKKMECSTQLQVFTKDYKMDNLTRKLPSIVDGLVMTRRRIYYAALNKFGYEGQNKFMKIFQFGGFVAENANYHHGDASLNSAITNMTHRFPNGGPICPLLQGRGQIGSSLKGGQDCGSARYISCRINRKVAVTLFPKADSQILNYLYEDGEKSIPRFYLPVAPYALFRSEKIPADGWRYMIWARDIPATLNALRQLIKSKGQNNVFTLPASTVGYSGRIISNGVDEFSVGTYKINDTYYTGFYKEKDGKDKDGNQKYKTVKVNNISTKEIVITSLPLRVWSKNYIESFRKFDIVKNTRGGLKKVYIDEYADEFNDYFCDRMPVDKCLDPATEIHFILRPDALNKMIESKFSLLEKMNKIFDAENKDIEDDAEGIDVENKESDGDNQPADINKTDLEFMIKNIDPIQLFFGLVVKMTHNLNFIDENGAVKEFNKYEKVLIHWFNHRHKYYTARIMRESTILNIKITYLCEKLRFCKNYLQLGFVEKLKEQQMIAILDTNKFARVNNGPFNRPGDADDNPTDKLFGLVFNNEGNYDYLLHIHTQDRSEENQIKMENNIKKLQSELDAINNEWKTDSFPGASQWLREIDAFEKVYNEGILSDWKFGEDDNAVFE
jgi:DNA topoisomerase-2